MTSLHNSTKTIHQDSSLRESQKRIKEEITETQNINCENDENNNLKRRACKLRIFLCEKFLTFSDR